MWVRLVPPDKKLRLSAVHRLCHCLVEVYFTTLLGIHTTTTMNTGDTEHLLHLTEAVLRFVLLPTKKCTGFSWIRINWRDSKVYKSRFQI